MFKNGFPIATNKYRLTFLHISGKTEEVVVSNS